MIFFFSSLRLMRSKLPILILVSLSLTASLNCGDDAGTGGSGGSTGVTHDLAKLQQVLETNANVAFAGYSDAVTTAKQLQTAIDTFVASPTEQNLAAAKRAWRVAREPYLQTEVFRFRASPIDDTNYNAADGEDGPEGSLNAWPLGEALIDYVKEGTDFGADQLEVTSHETGVSDPIPPNNIINSTSIAIDDALLASSVTAEDERDVIAGYHAIEFLLWGQDLNADGSADTKTSRETGMDTGGHRPATDFATDATCTSGPGVSSNTEICQRRGQYLKVAVAKLVSELENVRDGWAPGATYRTAFTTVDTVDAGKAKLLEILVGMGTLSEGELAGERMQIALSANSQEDEHSCFSDNTHRDIVLDARGISNAYFGVYAGYDGDLDGTDDVTTNAVNGYGFDDYLRDLGLTDVAANMESALATTKSGYDAIDASARAGTPFDVMIMNAGGDAAKPARDTIVALNAQSAQIANIAVALEVGTPDDVVDPEASACDTTDPTKEC
jgi:putative iron-regulated protein